MPVPEMLMLALAPAIRPIGRHMACF